METKPFSELGLSEGLLRAVEDMGFEEATPIQTQTIPLILEGKDVIGHSQTGTGKTAAFGLPIFDIVDRKSKALQFLILCPTRELAIQASDEMRKFGKYMHGVKTLAIYGGQPIDRQIKALKGGIQIVIGTPGRVMDHMRRKTLKMHNLKMLVLDEADEMLNMGFREDIETILESVPEERRTILFSATMPKPILNITKNYQKDPIHVKVVHKQLTVPSIEQYYYETRQNKKVDLLCRVIDIEDPKLLLVFCNKKRTVDELVSNLQVRGYIADCIHGDIKQTVRIKVINKFRKGDIDILVATDVAARGIDIDDIDLVVNYDLPQDEEYYVHRIGRTGRAGRSGKAFTFVAGRKESYGLRDIQKYTKAKIKLKKAPSLNEVEEVKIKNYIKKVDESITSGDLDKYTKIVEKIMEELDVTSIDIAAALVKAELSAQMGDSKQSNSIMDFDDTSSEQGMARLFINVGRKDKLKPSNIVGAIANETGIKGKLIGAIDIHETFSFVEVPKEYAHQVIEVMKNTQIKGRKVNIEPANKRK